MDKKTKLDLIKMAQTHLVNSPQDVMHDITHHYRTYLLAQEIMKNVDGPVDSDLVEILCWWHDVKVPELSYDSNRVVDVVADYLAALVPEEAKDNVLDSMINHEFGSKPEFPEGKVLQDADKLEILSPERMRIATEDAEAGFLDKKALLNSFQNILNDWIPLMPGRYNYEYSKQKHFILLEQIQPDFKRFSEFLEE